MRVVGGGEVRIDGCTSVFTGARLIAIPAGAVHAFAWQPESRGHVLMVTRAFADGLNGTVGALAGGGVFATGRNDARAFVGLSAAFATPTAARSARMAGHLQLILATLLDRYAAGVCAAAIAGCFGRAPLSCRSRIHVPQASIGRNACGANWRVD